MIHRKNLITYIIFTLLYSFANPSYAQISALRPENNIVQPRAITEIYSPKNWEMYRLGMVNSIAALLAMYPNHEFYFLARDGEYLYDTAQELLKLNPNEKNKLHLLNVSSKSKLSDNLSQYLSQEGLDRDKIGERNIVLIDSGFIGTIPKVIKSLLPVDMHKQIKIHMLASRASDIPSLFTFFGDLLPNSFRPKDVDVLTVQFQELPHYHRSSSDYMIENDNIWPMTNLEQEEIKRQISLRIMSDIKDFSAKEEIQIHFNKTWQAMTALSKCLNAAILCNEIQRDKIESELVNLGVKYFLRDYLEASLLGMIEIKNPIAKTLIDELKRLPEKDHTGKLGTLEKWLWRGNLRVYNYNKGIEDKRWFERLRHSDIDLKIIKCSSIFTN